MRIRRFAAATALAVGLAPAAMAQQGGQTTAPPAQVKTAFCVEAEALYGELLSQPAGQKQGTAAVTYGIYRNSAAQRIVTLAWAGQCNMGTFLMLERRHMRDVMSGPNGSTASSGFGVEPQVRQ